MGSGTRRAGDFCWVNMLMPRPGEARDFFGQVLGWTFFEMPGIGHGIRAGGRDIGGLFDLEGPGTPPGLSPILGVMVKVDGVDALDQRFEALGGRAKAPFDVGGQGRMAVCFYPEGAEFDLWQPGKMAGTEVEPAEPGAPAWFEVGTTDPARPGRSPESAAAKGSARLRESSSTSSNPRGDARRAGSAGRPDGPRAGRVLDSGGPPRPADPNRGRPARPIERGPRVMVERSESWPSGRWPSVELPRPLGPRPEIAHVLFDFDGTISLVRQGWPEVMVPMFVEVLPRLPGESPADVERLALDDIMTLNGKQTIYQMIRLANRIRERGGEPLEPLAYKHEYLRRLEAHIGARTEGLAAGTIHPDAHLVHGVRALLEHLQSLGLRLYLASGTDESAVRREADLLDVAKYFGPNLHGAQDDYKTFSKKLVIERILAENGIDGRRLLSFGDGYVEVENTAQVGGLAVAVASDEANNGSGRVDAWKRERLLGVGADAVIPDYRDAVPFVDYLLGR